MNKREEVLLKQDVVDAQKAIMADVRISTDKEAEKSGIRKKYYVETYGCQQNESDSEILKGMLSQMGFESTNERANADVVLFNTCAVRENAELKVFGNIGAMKHEKERNPDMIIGVCGCMMQQEKICEQIRRKYKQVDMVFGTHSLYSFPELLQGVLKSKNRVFDVQNIDGHIAEGFPTVRAEGPCAWVSVMYGCNNFCSYCIVPYVRGRERSREKQAILMEVSSLAEKGYKEIMLLGQNVNSYGKDLESETDFADLLSEVCKIPKIERIRFMTSHPKDISDKLIDIMAENKKICKQLHLPVQSGNNKILKIMNRKYTKEDYLEKIDKIKAKMPDITLTTDIIVGFPGETAEDFNDTIDVLEMARFDTIFSFIYSRRDGTPAAKMPDVISDEEKKKNFNRLLEVQDRISFEKNKALEGKILSVLVEGTSKNNDEFICGRTEGGKIVNFKGEKSLIGEIVNVKITEAKTWSLKGELK